MVQNKAFPGEGFHPTHEECVGYADLKNKNEEFEIPHIKVVDALDINDKHIIQTAEEDLKAGAKKEWFYFYKKTTRKKNQRQWSVRKSENGSWKANASPVKIRGRDGVIGIKRTLEYRKKGGDRTDWKLTEYYGEAELMFRKHPAKVPDTYSSWVICKLYKTNRRTPFTTNLNENDDHSQSTNPDQYPSDQNVNDHQSQSQPNQYTSSDQNVNDHSQSTNPDQYPSDQNVNDHQSQSQPNQYTSSDQNVNDHQSHSEPNQYTSSDQNVNDHQSHSQPDQRQLPQKIAADMDLESWDLIVSWLFSDSY
ncbi:NAC domain-containing protein 87-like [Cannabis sativa]|uniref:NAC domain-containing protein 87-like n=1 Tax=Cannabis sativa TaxID=3483 RepID=UPI0029CA02F4|nr:NAC domain-containing protein 87-like [Cannabis sativa]